MLGAHVAAGISGYAEFQALVESSKLRALAVSAPSRLPGVNVPTLREQGVDVEFGNWRGVKQRLRRALAISQGDPTIFLARPLAAVLLAITLFIVLLPLMLRLARGRGPSAPRDGGAAAPG